jgi:hypothetical protein
LLLRWESLPRELQKQLKVVDPSGDVLVTLFSFPSTFVQVDDYIIPQIKETYGIVEEDRGHDGGGESLGHDKPDDNVPPTLPPPSPSVASKRQFSVLHSGSVNDMETSRTATSKINSSHSTPLTSNSKRERMTGAIALTTIGHGLADLNSSYCKALE